MGLVNLKGQGAGFRTCGRKGLTDRCGFTGAACRCG